jgi:hypothetical protein
MASDNSLNFMMHTEINILRKKIYIGEKKLSTQGFRLIHEFNDEHQGKEIVL